MARHGLAEVVTGAFVLVVAIGFLAFAIAHSGRSTGAGYPLKATFDHIDGLNLGADVRIAGVKVGSVTDEQIDPKSFTAIVTMTVRNDIKLPTDTGASILTEGLLGGEYISLSPGGNETNLKPGQTITITQSSINIEELLGKFIFSATSLASPKGGGAGNSGEPQGSSSHPQSNNAGNTHSGGGALAPLSK
jgi:phospholipid/cholesterol/gamma-HCH transport system substrate-binding protein